MCSLPSPLRALIILFSLHGCVCVHISAQMSETQVLSAISSSSSFSCSSHAQTLPPPPPHPLTSTTAASSTGRPVGGATHVLTSPWQPLSSPCPPRHTHSGVTRPHPPHQTQDTHTYARVYTLNSLDCIRCGTNFIHMPCQPCLKSPCLLQITLDELWDHNVAFFFINRVEITHSPQVLAQLCGCTC